MHNIRNNYIYFLNITITILKSTLIYLYKFIKVVDIFILYSLLEHGSMHILLKVLNVNTYNSLIGSGLSAKN